MDLAARKYNFIQELTLVDEVIMEKLERVLKRNRRDLDWGNSLTEEEFLEIKEGVNQANKREFISHDEVMEKFSKWK